MRAMQYCQAPFQIAAAAFAILRAGGLRERSLLCTPRCHGWAAEWLERSAAQAAFIKAVGANFPDIAGRP